MASACRRGALIVFEGCDRSGKSTQVSKIVEYLSHNDIKSAQWRFPDRTTAIGKCIDDYLSKRSELDDHAVHLLFAANRWEAVPKIKQLLEAGTSIIVDRYSYSGVAYSAAKDGIDIGWCKNPEIGLPLPDAVLYLDLGNVDKAEKREDFGMERYEKSEFQKKVYDNYNLIKDKSWQLIDADRSIEVIHEEIKDIVLKTMKNVENKPLGELWVTSS